MPDKKGRPQRLSKGAIPPARASLGVNAVRALFETTANQWAKESAERDRWRGLMVLGADGTTLRVPDSVENRQEFGLPKTGRSTSGYPQVRAGVLMVLRSHQWLAFDFADIGTGEGTVVWPLIERYGAMADDFATVYTWIMDSCFICGSVGKIGIGCCGRARTLGGVW